ncbi:MAG: hypothetical protein M1839_008131 [Geoglossum umbratile]|nr:MAG: hypothetical protein M1839_008131 [Geoglossum umbratile]
MGKYVAALKGIVGMDQPTDTDLFWIVARNGNDGIGQPTDRYLVDIDRVSRNVQTPRLISISGAELRKAVLAATGHHYVKFSRIMGGAFSTSYQVSILEDRDIQYVVQLRHYGNVTSMNLLMSLISSTIDPSILPLPAVYPIPGEEQRGKTVGIGRQITRLVPGPMACNVYPHMSHKEKLVFVRNMAAAFQATWQIPLPEERLIGQLCATQAGDRIVLSVGPEPRRTLGGPFTSVRDYLRAYIRMCLDDFKRQEGIDEYKKAFLPRVTDFVEGGMHNIPAIVEDIPVVVVHSDMGPHNVIVSRTTPTDIKAIIDWEFVARAPFASVHKDIEMLFRKPASSGFGPEYEHADELRDAFWGAIPEWKAWNESEATRVFLEWFWFGLFMKWTPKRLDELLTEELYDRLENMDEEDMEGSCDGPDSLEEAAMGGSWAENARVIEGLLGKYGESAGSG